MLDDQVKCGNRPSHLISFKITKFFQHGNTLHHNLSISNNLSSMKADCYHINTHYNIPFAPA